MLVSRSLSPAVTVIAFVCLVWFLRTAEALMMPVVLALVLGVVVAPMTDRIERVGAPRALSAFVVLLTTVALVLALLSLLRPVLSDAVELAPQLEWELRQIVAAVQPALENVAAIQDRIEETLNEGTPEVEPAQEGVAVPSPLDALWYAPGILGQTMIFIGTLYFFLLSRTEVYRAIHRDDSALDNPALARAEVEVSRYFLTITTIYATFGTLVALAMSLIGMPSPLMWGVAAFLVNYILYLGPMVFALVLLVAGIVVFDGAYSLVPALVYVGMNSVEGQFVTPAMVSRQMSINPLLVFVALVFWLWLWGPLGGVIAVPLLVWGLRIRAALQGNTTT